MAKTTKTSRAEKTRSRRNQSKRKPVKSSRDRNQQLERRMPPVMVRGGSYAPVSHTKKKRQKKTVRRRYDISVPTPGVSGVEIRLPSLPVWHLSWKILSFGLASGLSILLYFMLTSPIFQIQTVEVQGLIRLTPDEINRSLNLVNQPVFSLDPADLEDSLSANFAELKDISIQIGLPAQVLISVNERVPLIAWNQDGKTTWVDGDGYAFTPRGEVGNLVVVNAMANPPHPVKVQAEPGSMTILGDDQAFTTPEFINAVLLMRSQAPEKVALAYDPQHGLGWQDARGWEVFFGMDGSQIDVKLMVYKSIIKQIKAEGITPALINLERVHAPYYRMER